MLFDEGMINILEAMKIPNTYWTNKTYEYQYWFRSLLQKLYTSIEFKGLPESWPKDFFRQCIWAIGYLPIFQTIKFGDPEQNNVAFYPAPIGGKRDFYLQPTNIIVTNPFYHKELTIHKDCEILKLTPDAYYLHGCLDIVDHYAKLLAEADKGILSGLINAKFPMCAIGNDMASRQKLKAIYDKIVAGETLVVWEDDELFDSDEIERDKEPFFTWINDLKSNYIVTEIIDNQKELINQFYMEVGIPTIINDKKAHTLNAEADFQSAQSQARVDCWMESLNDSIKLINGMFNVNWEVEYAEREENDSMGSRAIPEQDRMD